MYKIIYPSYDATIYERYPDRNTGIDQIIELTKFTRGESAPDVVCEAYTWQNNYNTRILMKYDLSTIESMISSGEISGPVSYYLIMRASETIALPIDYTIYAYPLSESWSNGNGNYNDDPQITNGVSWNYKTGLLTADSWSLSTKTGSYTSTTGGGTWNESYAASQSFSYDDPDVRMNVTSIVNAWLSGSVDNNGFIIKHSNTVEGDTSVLGSLKFFSKDTHTIYIPHLEVFWGDSIYSGSFSSSNSPIGDNYIIYAKNLQLSYKENETVKIRFGVRDMYPTKTYSTSSAYRTDRLLPDTSYYKIVDDTTGHDIVAFDDVGTKVQRDDSGHFITLDFNSFLPERYYRIIFKIVNDTGTRFYDDGFYFRVDR